MIKSFIFIVTREFVHDGERIHANRDFQNACKSHSAPVGMSSDILKEVCGSDSDTSVTSDTLNLGDLVNALPKVC